MVLFRQLISFIFILFTGLFTFSLNANPSSDRSILLLDTTASALRQSTTFTTHIDSGLSIRNHEKGHFHPMFDWDDGQYAEYAWWEETDKGSIVNFMNFRVAFPPDLAKNNPNKKYPAILMLHGAGGSGRKDDSGFEYSPTDPRYDNNSKQLGNPGRSHLDAVNRDASHPRAFPGIVIIPQSSYNGSWGDDNVSMVIEFLMWMIQEYNIDQDRIVIHGLSNGAKGVWKMATFRPDLFAAALPMSGVGTDIDSMTDVLATTPMWIFQGDRDSNPSVSYSTKWYDELVAKGGTPRYTLYESTGHNTWSKAYAEEDFFSWILKQDNKHIQVMGGDPREDECDPVEGPLELGFSAGFLAYQWLRNGEEIAGATDRFFTADKEGVYQVRFKRKTDGTWDESFAMDVFYEEPHTQNLVASLRAEGSTTLPYYGDDRTLKLIASPGFEHYEWYKDDELIQDVSREELYINNEAGDLFRIEDTGSYTVKIVDECGNASAPSEPVKIIFDSTLLLSSGKPELTRLMVYPNPFPESLHIEVADRSLLGEQVIIYDSAGKMVLRKSIPAQKFRLHLSDLLPGVYIIAVGERRVRIIKSGG